MVRMAVLHPPFLDPHLTRSKHMGTSIYQTALDRNCATQEIGLRYFLDTEFNGMGGDLISLALVCGNIPDRELYAATSCPNPIPWVADNVMPIINCAKAMAMSCEPNQFGMLIAEFLSGDRGPVIVADWPDDIAYFCKALIVGPGQMVNIPMITFHVRRVDAYPTDLPDAVQHNALWDARALRAKID